MFISKRLLFSFLSIMVVWAVVGLLTPMPSEVEATYSFDKFSKGKCDVPPTWGEIIRGKKRWVKVWDGAAYCDRETGIVWEAEVEVDEDGKTWNEARFHCIDQIVGGNGQKGWRLPSISELTSLVDTNSTQCTGGGPCLPDGNPFQIEGPPSYQYWSATTSAANDLVAWVVVFVNGSLSDFTGKNSKLNAWCVRGAMSADAY